MDDVEQLKMMDLEDRLRFARKQNEELQQEVKRLIMLLNGEDVIKNSLSSRKHITAPFDKLKSSYRNKKA